MLASSAVYVVHTGDAVSGRITVVVVVVVVVAGCCSVRDVVLTVDTVRRTEGKALECRRRSTLQPLVLVVNSQVMVDPTQQSLITQRELVSGDELTSARHAAETIDVVDVTACAHHKIRHAEPELAAGALRTEQSAHARTRIIRRRKRFKICLASDVCNACNRSVLWCTGVV